MNGNKPKVISNVHVYYLKENYYISPTIRNSLGLWIETTPIKLNTPQSDEFTKSLEIAHIASLNKEDSTLTTWKDNHIRKTARMWVSIVWLDNSIVKVANQVKDKKFLRKSIWHEDNSTLKEFNTPDFATLTKDVLNRLS